jgi:oxygen-independent coproporphyrinogen-3 oxidase
MVAMGVTSISKVGPTYSQNMRSLDEYYQRIDAGRLAVFRGIELGRDDLIRRDVITRLICHFVLDFRPVEEAWGIRFSDYFADDLERLSGMAADGLVEIDAQGIRVLSRGRLLIRNICMAFDAYLPPVEQQKNFSRVI